MAQRFTRLFAAVGGGLVLCILLLLLLLWAIDPDFGFVRNLFWLIREIVDLLAALCGWFAAFLNGLHG